VLLSTSSPNIFHEVLEGLPQRVGSQVGNAYGEAVGAWAGRAAESFRAQLADASALPHRFITDHYSRELGFDAREIDALGNALDLLQVSFDLADNLADRELDAALGRSYLASCDDIPFASLLCLPAVLSNCAIAILYEHFPSDRFNPGVAVSKASLAIGAMVRGQGEPANSAQRIELVSGRQGLLLCLPFWLASDPSSLPCTVSDFEAWAYLFGCTWELHQVHLEENTESSRTAWHRAVAEARLAWPSFGPFAAGGPLAPQATMSGCLC
jgi:hypothetical protein